MSGFGTAHLRRAILVGLGLALHLVASREAMATNTSRAFVHGSQVVSATLSPNGAYLATVCVDGTVRVWDVREHSVSLDIAGREEKQYFVVRFSPDSRFFCTYRFGELAIGMWKLDGKHWQSRDTVRFGKVTDKGVAVGAFGAKSNLFYAAYTIAVPPSEEEAASTRIVPVFIARPADAPRGSAWRTLGIHPRLEERELLSFAGGVRVSPDERTLYLTGWDRIFLFDLKSGSEQVVDVLGIPEMAFSDDGRYVCVVVTRQLMMPDHLVERRATLWRRDGSRLTHLKGDLTLKGPYGMTFVPDSERIVLADQQEGLRVVRIANGRTERAIAKQRPVQQLVFTDSQTLVAVGYEPPLGRSVHVWAIDEWDGPRKK